MRVAVVGMGALGTVYACLLKERGHEVVGVDRPQVIDAVGKSGLRVTGIWGEHAQALDALVSGVEQLAGRELDVVVVTVKSFDTAAVSQELARVIAPETLVVLAQNGYGNFEAAAASIPPRQLVLARVIFGSETLAAGASKVTVIADDVILGSPANLIPGERLEQLAAECSAAGIPTRVSDQVLRYVWGKIIYNSALNSLGAILEVPYGRLAEGEDSRALMDAIVREIFAVLSAMGEQTLWPDAEAYLEAFYGSMVPSTAQHHASMLQDIQRGRRTEIEALNGAVVRLGRTHGVPTPVNEVVTRLVRAKERLRAEALA
ncbi:MAG: ketopantoate reductase family protein [Syntrophomonadaceae bacterium]|jgi:2-dehydropantoate 2-reductase|nr:ketopantoate reductase family protein [Syntrophomonadaceae bacterium]MDH7498112.1 ketopantoate reductase family protein [Syntrophomonadaceae bacterium]